MEAFLNIYIYINTRLNIKKATLNYGRIWSLFKQRKV